MSMQYGFYCGGDPRKFFPEYESCTDEEIKNHSAACELWNLADARGEILTPEACPSGWIAPGIHATCAPYGIGCYEIPDDEEPGTGGQMSAPKEAEPGDIKLYRESPVCYVVRVIEAVETGPDWVYLLENIKTFEGFSTDRTGELFTVSKSKEHGQMASWHLFDIDGEYAKYWLEKSGIDLAEII